MDALLVITKFSRFVSSLISERTIECAAMSAVLPLLNMTEAIHSGVVDEGCAEKKSATAVDSVVSYGVV